jgi:hypothetical protein
MKTWLGVLLFVFAGVVVFLIGSSETRDLLSAPRILGGPVRVADESGDRVHFLTSQWEKRVLYVGGWRSSSNHRTISHLHVDLWSLDSANLQPIARHRLHSAKVNADASALGVEAGVMWARLPDLVAIRLSDGVVVADVARIEAANPPLAGLLPRPPEPGIFFTEQMQPIKFTAQQGLVVMLADARRVRIDPRSLLATPVEPPAQNTPADPRWRVIGSLANGMEWRALLRGHSINRTEAALDWLGLIAQEELAEAQRIGAVTEIPDYSRPTRYRLYRGVLRSEETFVGPRWRLKDLAPLPESPEFVMGGLLIGAEPSWGAQQAMWRRDPESVFVLARDRVDEAGTLFMTRIAGPAGKPVWNTALKLSYLSGWHPGETHAVMFGPYPGAERSPMAEPDEDPVTQVRSIDLRSGALSEFNLDLHRNWPAQRTTAD